MTAPASPVTVRPAQARGVADFGWLDSRHSFSFGEYYDPAHMGFRSLRVINEDRVAGGGGFPTHPHRDMEIFSYVLEGRLEHRDSLGNGRVLAPGQVQLMSAGRGVTHSEFNPSPTQTAHFLQIWIQPSARGLTPSYTEWHPDPARANDPLVRVISPDGREGSAVIHQDAHVFRVRLAAGQGLNYALAPGRGAWVQVLRGGLTLNGTPLSAGDGASVEAEGALALVATDAAEALLFDLR
jgi:redox-sensitive bicupin YhaK (pirin superfamily)